MVIFKAFGNIFKSMFAFFYMVPINEVVAFIFLAIGSYFDIKHDRNIPDGLLYASLVISIALAFFSSFDLLQMSINAGLIGLVGYWLYKFGQIGGADVIILMDLAFLMPPYLGYPFYLWVLFLASLVFAIYIIIKFFPLFLSKKPKKLAYLFIIPYILIMAISLYISLLPLSFYLLFTLSFLIIFLFYGYRDDITRIFEYTVKVEDALEEVLAEDIDGINKVITKEDIARLKKMKRKTIKIYKYPPFVPFLFLGFIGALAIKYYLFSVLIGPI